VKCYKGTRDGRKIFCVSRGLNNMKVSKLLFFFCELRYHLKLEKKKTLNTIYSFKLEGSVSRFRICASHKVNAYLAI